MTPSSLRRAVLLPLALIGLAPAAEAQRPPSDATVFIRMFGVVRAEYQRAWKETVESEEVEVATGSGFLVSPAGAYVTGSTLLVDGGTSLIGAGPFLDMMGL